MKKLFTIVSMISLMTMANIAMATSHKQQENNKRTVVAFYNQIINQKNYEAASHYLGDHYTQHDPGAKDGFDGLKEIVDDLNTNYPNAHGDIKRVFADGDFVIMHVHSMLEAGARGRANVNMFKLEHGKIVEHWEVSQDIPEQSANDNGMF